MSELLLFPQEDKENRKKRKAKNKETLFTALWDITVTRLSVCNFDVNTVYHNFSGKKREKHALSTKYFDKFFLPNDEPISKAEIWQPRWEEAVKRRSKNKTLSKLQPAQKQTA